MLGAPPELIVEGIIYLGLCLAPFGCFACAVRKWVEISKRQAVPSWRRIAVWVGFLAVAGQAVSFALCWTSLGNDVRNFQMLSRWMLGSFLVALPLVLIGKGASRWWLLSSSVIWFVVGCFFVLSA
jgi:hypothetical protein